jgi:hypothetical protein
MYIREVMEHMETKHTLSLEVHKLLVKLLDKYLLGGEVPDNLLAHLSLYFLTKFHKTLLAFRMLVVSGFDEDASILLRTLVEAAITLGYISKEPNQRVSRFIEYEHIAQYNLLNIMDKHYPETDISDERRKTIIDEYQQIQHNFSRKTQWSDKSISQMAEEVGMTFWYDVVYKPESSYVHSNISATRGFMIDGPDQLLLAVGPQVFNATDIISKTCELTRIILSFALPNILIDDGESKEIWNKAQALIQEEFESKRNEEE